MKQIQKVVYFQSFGIKYMIAYKFCHGWEKKSGVGEET